MSEQSTGGESGGGWGAGKIILVVVLVLGGLGAICCGVGLFMAKDALPMMEGPIQFALQTQNEFGQGALGTMEADPENPSQMIILVGIPGGPDAESIADIQDRAWKLYVNTHAEGGFPARRLAVGTTGGAMSGSVVEWQENIVTFDELEERTGVTRPPINELLDQGK